MGKYIVQGGNRLSGSVSASGAKNSALVLIAASLINKTDEPCILKNVPILEDTLNAVRILEFFGCDVIFEKNTLCINSHNARFTPLPDDMAKKMRSSVLFAGACLSRFNEAYITNPGGCAIGKRPIDIHIESFGRLGIKTDEYSGFTTARADKIKNTKITLPFPSVGATENIMLACAGNECSVVIENAAREPEITELAHYLSLMGADIRCCDGKITIKGNKNMKGCRYTVMPDRIEAGTFLIAAAATGSDICVENVVPSHLYSLCDILYDIGCEIEADKSQIRIFSPERLDIDGIYIETAPYPLFPTDLQPQLTALFAKSKGRGIICERIFEKRNAHISQLNKMGADIITENENRFIINGKASLMPSKLEAKDLRGGAALICAALSAEGISIIGDNFHIKRGYENIEKKLSELGAVIKTAD